MSGARDSAWIIGKQQAEADNGMVASLHPLASAAGLGPAIAFMTPGTGAI